MHGRTWVRGLCWKCESTDRLVLWLGPVHTDRGTGVFHACEQCIRRLEELALADVQRGIRSE